MSNLLTPVPEKRDPVSDSVSTVIHKDSSFDFAASTNMRRRFVEYFKPGHMPIMVGLLTAVIMSAIKITGNPAEWKHIILLEIVVVLVAAVVDMYARKRDGEERFDEERRRWQDTIDEYKPLGKLPAKALELYTGAPLPLREYIEVSIVDGIKAMEELAAGLPVKRPYAEQITLAENLIKNTSVRFWATTTDAPSVLWEQGFSYFNAQEKLSVTDKKRLVMLTREELLNDYIKNRGPFDEYIEWHKTYGFSLKFLLVETWEGLDEEIGRSVNDNNPLKDFVIKDEEFIYGRTRRFRGREVELKYISHEAGANLDQFNKYLSLFSGLWRRANTLERTLTWLEEERDKEALQAQTRRDYEAEFASASQGKEFFQAVCTRISGATASLLAVDMADMKQGVERWSWQTEYVGFLEASIDAAKRGNGALEGKRLYIVREFRPLGSLMFRRVLKDQIDAGIEVIVLESKDAAAGDLDMDDFILIDQDFGFRLGNQPNSDFSMLELEYGKNLIAKARLRDFRAKFDAFYNIPTAKKFKGPSQALEFDEFLRTLDTDFSMSKRSDGSSSGA